ncbi:tyrosine-type recombinase/integrase [Undibacterium sp. JH2W]|uniref:tyrosine-type recombinase/integrase n=1 Tax=Undibacterium sp. JH2W TaxID=3413037 RepID=UPI003BF346EF
MGLQDSARKAKDRSSFKEMTFHDLRHSAAPMLINKDVDLFTIGAILGHKNQTADGRFLPPQNKKDQINLVFDIKPSA